MSRSFTLDRCPYDEGEVLYRKKEITLEPGVTVLVGCNGSGKTTLLRLIDDHLKYEKVPHLRYDNLQDGGHNAKRYAMARQDFSTVGTLMCSSEGEQIQVNMANTAGRMGQLVRNNPDAKEYWFLFDAIDSGLSVDNICELKRDLFDTVLQYAGSAEVYIIVSANEFEMCRGEMCFDVREGKYRRFKSYEAYRNFILRSRAHKDKRHPEEQPLRKRRTGAPKAQNGRKLEVDP